MTWHAPECDFGIESSPARGSLNGVISMMTLSRARLVALVFSWLPFLPVSAADWPRWRGPLNTGNAVAEPALTSLPATPTVRWQLEVGEGFTSPPAALV